MDERITEKRNQARMDGNPVLREKSFEKLLSVVKAEQPKKILEIGTNVGLTGIAMLLESKDATLTGIEIDEDVFNKAKENYKIFGVEKRTRLFLGSASDILPLISGEFDFVFIDGPKGHYYEYLQYVKPLVVKGGIIFADNVLFRGFLSGKFKVPKRHSTILHSLQNFVKEISDSEKFDTEIIDIEDGISISRKKY
ncbi:MAG: class I SAM-dependent methyltransferase [Clostridia bacterium]|nr:class I SAM-dependent methyltransferase [Clostridia bacterium]